MSYVVFITKAFALSPVVFLRYLPVLVMFGLIIWGLFTTTDNPWVIGMIMFLLLTYGYTFLLITGMRAGLMTRRITDAPTAEGLLKVTTRLVFTHMIFQLILLLVGTGVVSLIAGAVLAEDTNAALGVFSQYTSALYKFDAEALAEIAPEMEALVASPEALRSGLVFFYTGVVLWLGVSISLMGIPMAAGSANAVQYSPENDLIYGIGRYFPHQFTVFVLASVIPTALYAMLAPAEYLVVGMSGEGSGLPPVLVMIFGVWLFIAPCASWAAMALGYEGIRNKMKRSREAERVPEIDYEAEREKVRELRQLRKPNAGSGVKMYDPRAKR